MPTVVDEAYYFRTSGMTLAEAEERGLVSRNEDGELSSVFTLGMKLAEDASDDTVNGLVEGSVDLKDAVVATTAATTESGQQVALQALAEGKSVEETTALVRVGEKLAGQEDVAELMAEDAEFKARVEETAKNVAAERAVLQEQIAKAETADEAKALAERDAALERGEVEEDWVDTGDTASFSLASQRSIIDSLRNSGEYDVFYKAVDRLEKNGKPSSNREDLSESYAKVSVRLRNDVLRLSNGEIDLAEGEHVVSVSHLWHSYYEHCLDYFVEGSQLNLTHDDLRMIPDIVMNYDSVKIGEHNNGYTLEFTKKYGDVEYFVVEDVESKRKNPRGAIQKTIYVKDITKSASDGAFHPTPTSKGYTRTESINPIWVYIKQNYVKKAIKICKNADAAHV